MRSRWLSCLTKSYSLGKALSNVFVTAVTDLVACVEKPCSPVFLRCEVIHGAISRFQFGGRQFLPHRTTGFFCACVERSASACHAPTPLPWVLAATLRLCADPSVAKYTREKSCALARSHLFSCIRGGARTWKRSTILNSNDLRIVEDDSFP